MSNRVKGWHGPYVAREELVKRQRATELRRSMTRAERILWAQLKDGRLHGFHIRRQQVIAGFIVDFYCHEARLAVEVDGSIHTQQLEYDREREQVLAALDIRILRISNEAVYSHPGRVAQQIASAIANRTGLI